MRRRQSRQICRCRSAERNTVDVSPPIMPDLVLLRLYRRCPHHTVYLLPSLSSVALIIQHLFFFPHRLASLLHLCYISAAAVSITPRLHHRIYFHQFPPYLSSHVSASAVIINLILPFIFQLPLSPYTHSHFSCHPLLRASDSVCLLPPLSSSSKTPYFLCRPAIRLSFRPAHHQHISVIPASMPPLSIHRCPKSPPFLHPPPMCLSSWYIFLPPSSSSCHLARNRTHFAYLGQDDVACLHKPPSPSSHIYAVLVSVVSCIHLCRLYLTVSLLSPYLLYHTPSRDLVYCHLCHFPCLLSPLFRVSAAAVVIVLHL